MSDVSVVIPAYNAERFIAEAIDTALSQTYPPREVIVVNDGSTDATETVLRPYMARIRYVRQANRGPAAARNAGVQIAQGRWIAFLDVDDLWSAEKTALQMEMLRRWPTAVLCYTSVQNVTAAGQRELIWPTQVCTTPDDRSLIDPWSCLLDLPPTPAVVVSRRVILAAGGFCEALRTAEDLDLWVRLRALGPFVGTDRPLVLRRLRSGSITATVPATRQYEQYLMILKRRRDYIAHWGKDSRWSGRAFIHTRIAVVHFREGRRLQSLAHACQGLLAPHPDRVLAARLMVELGVGTHLYERLASVVRRTRERAIGKGAPCSL